MRLKTAVLTLLFFITLIMAFSVSLVSAPNLPVHNIDTGLDYATIQDAIDAPETLDGHTIRVDAGIYFENVIVNKALTLIGENKEATIIDGGGTSVIHLTANNVDISGFTITNGGHGILLEPSSGVTVVDNYITKLGGKALYIKESTSVSVNYNIINGCRGGGIYLWHCRGTNILRGNNVSNSEGTGIDLYFSDNDFLEENIVSGHSHYGVYLYCSNTILRKNSMTSNRVNFGVYGDYLSDFFQDMDISNIVDGKPVYYLLNEKNKQIPFDAGYVAIVNSANVTARNLTLSSNYQGLLLAGSKDCILENLTVANNDCGIFLFSSNNNTIAGNTLANGSFSGIRLRFSDNNKIFDNMITNHSSINGWGMELGYSNNNSVYNNTIANNWGGIVFYGSANNLFYHNNLIANIAYQTRQDTSGHIPPYYSNAWDNGYPSGGNYWSDYTGVDFYSGPFQNETGSDGIGDTPYVASIHENNRDRYPLMYPWGPPPSPDFNISVDPNRATVQKGASTTATVTLTSISDYSQEVSLSSSGEPSGVTVDFDLSVGIPTLTSIMTVQVGVSVPIGTYPITITGIGTDGKTHSTTFTLIVTTLEIPEVSFSIPMVTSIAVAVYVLISKQRGESFS